MSQQRWPRMLEIFDEVVELPQADRAAALRRLCGSDSTLLGAVEGLLDGDGRVSPDFLEGPPVVASAESSVVRPLPAEHIGPYRLIETIGEGGMGSVFLAERDDGTFERRVAIKVIRPGMESAEMVRRLETERQILAGLDHPAIARLLDAGATPEGSPYFVMEAVDGVTIDRYCDGLSVRRRVALFLEVCRAVDAAHRSLIVHRDLKPSNILVTPSGQPKVLDFGIAKWLDPESSTDSSANDTADWQRLLTPGYASPEQIAGRRLTTATDVYSLGVVLYKILTGKLPFRFEGKSMSEIERVLTNDSPPPPSAVVDRQGQGSGLSRSLSRDLDHIVLKALRGDVEERYPSVQLLGDDLERWQGGFPVTARRGNVRYRLGKFVRRHRAAVAVAGMLMVMVAVFATDRAVQGARLASALELSEMERKRVQEERDAKKEVIELIVDFFRFGDPESSSGVTLTVLEALDRSQTRLDLFESQPEVEATLRRTVGLIYLNLGLPEKADPHLRRVHEITTRSYGDDSFEAALSRSDFGRVTWQKGDVEGARRMLQGAVDQVRRIRGDRHRDLIGPLNTLVGFFCWYGNYEEAIEPSIEAAELASLLTDLGSAERVAAMTHRAIVVRHTGGSQDALKLYSESLSAHLLWRGKVHPDTASVMNNLGKLWLERGNPEKALEFHQDALEIRRRLYPEGHELVAQSLFQVGRVAVGQGDVEAAEASFTESFDLLLEKNGAADRQTVRLAGALANLWLENDKPKSAARLLETHLETWRARIKSPSGTRSWLESTLGAALSQLGRFAEAEALLLDSQAVFETLYDEDDLRTQANLRRLVSLYEAWPVPAKAAEFRPRLTD